MASVSKRIVVDLFFGALFVASIFLLYNADSAKKSDSNHTGNEMTPFGMPARSVILKRQAAIKEAKKKGISTYTFEVKLPPPPIMAR